jgi:UDP-N-acetylmuramate dehydrogenase
MPAQQEMLHRFAEIPHLTILEGAPLSRYTRFGIGGPGRLYVETPDESSFVQALAEARASGLGWTVIGGGTNLVVSDGGFSGIVLRFTGAEIENEEDCVRAAAGAELQALVDSCIERGLKGIETMTGIPGSVGGAIYGNAGAYGHSIDERAREVHFHDGARIRVFGNAECEFRYRESVFKRHKEWIVFSVTLRMDRAPAAELRETADGILKIRNQKYPPTMKCAGSIFKNLILAELPESARSAVPREIVREGKIPSAWFLEQVGAKGMRRGDIQVADYHANLIYNAGHGVARDLCEVIGDLKARVRERFGIELEEEVQFI